MNEMYGISSATGCDSDGTHSAQSVSESDLLPLTPLIVVIPFRPDQEFSSILQVKDFQALVSGCCLVSLLPSDWSMPCDLEIDGMLRRDLSGGIAF